VVGFADMSMMLFGDKKLVKCNIIYLNHLCLNSFMIDGHLGTRVVITSKDLNTQDKRKLENWIE
jgi:hypothetical protein